MSLCRKLRRSIAFKLLRLADIVEGREVLACQWFISAPNKGPFRLFSDPCANFHAMMENGGRRYCPKCRREARHYDVHLDDYVEHSLLRCESCGWEPRSVLELIAEASV